MSVEFLSAGEKKQVINILKEKYGMEKFPFLILKSGKEKLRVYSGLLSKDELVKLSKTIRLENLGLYFGFFKENQLRLSLDALHLLMPEENIIEISDEEAEKWMKGEDLNIEKIKTNKEGFIIVKNNEDILGSGKITETKILNFLPKERRAR